MFALRSRKRVVEKTLAQADRARDATRWDLAAKLYRRVLDCEPANASIWVQYGHALKESGKLEKAEEAYRKAIVHEPAVADSHLQLGHVLKLQGKRSAAQAAYLVAYGLDPFSRDVLDELAALGWPNADPSFYDQPVGASIQEPQTLMGWNPAAPSFAFHRSPLQDLKDPRLVATRSATASKPYHLLFLSRDFNTATPTTAAVLCLVRTLSRLGVYVTIGVASQIEDARGADVRPIILSPACIQSLVQNCESSAVVSLDPAASTLLAQTPLTVPRWCWHSCRSTLSRKPEFTQEPDGRITARRFLLNEVYPYLSGAIFRSEYERYDSNLHSGHLIPLSADYVPLRDLTECSHFYFHQPELCVGTILKRQVGESRSLEMRHLNALLSMTKERRIDLRVECLRPVADGQTELFSEYDFHCCFYASEKERLEFFSKIDVFIPMSVDPDTDLEIVEAQRCGPVCLAPERMGFSEIAPVNFRSFEDLMQMLSLYKDRNLFRKHLVLTRRFAEMLPSADDVAGSLLALIERDRRMGSKRDNWRNPRPISYWQHPFTKPDIPFANLFQLPYEDFIKNLFPMLLGRPADPADVTRLLPRCLDQRRANMAEELLASAEFLSCFPQRGRAEWLRHWFQCFG